VLLLDVNVVLAVASSVPAPLSDAFAFVEATCTPARACADQLGSPPISLL
jgi:hypothetical protein